MENNKEPIQADGQVTKDTKEELKKKPENKEDLKKDQAIEKKEESSEKK